MPVIINDLTYCGTTGIAGNTLFMWLKEGIVSDVEYRYCRGWTLFAGAHVGAVKGKANGVLAVSRSD